jgi:hypothetical protein
VGNLTILLNGPDLVNPYPIVGPRRRAIVPDGVRERRGDWRRVEDKKIAPVDREQFVRPPGRVTLGSMNIRAGPVGVNLRRSARNPFRPASA